MKNICILGGGTAGWLTALYCLKYFNCNITLVESEKIGILGAGEGATPQLIDFLRELGIDIFDLIRHTGSTFKQGISFENWNGDGEKYFHDFYHRTSLGFEPKNSYLKSVRNSYNFFLKKLINEKIKFKDVIYPQIISYENKVDIKNINYSLHFDAFKIAEYLKNICKNLGVIHLNNEVIDVEFDDNLFINNLVLNNNIKIECDFLFDCSGFRREIIGKRYKSIWKSYEESLPVNKALSFRIKVEENEILPPYTKAIALKYGWMWQIPLQDRYGCGYVFDSNFIDEDMAKDEVENFLGKKIDVLNIFKFNAGCFEKVWIKNCLAVGLSSSFIEPLEATSIWLNVITQLSLFKTFHGFIFSLDEKNISKYNDIILKNNDVNLSFIYSHYLTKRKDSPFWNNFLSNTKMPEFLHNLMPKIKNSSLSDIDFFNSNNITGELYGLHSYLTIFYGLGYYDEKKFDTIDTYPDLFYYNNFVKFKKNDIITHNAMIENILKNK